MEKEEIQKEIPYWNYPQEKITEMLKSDPDSGLTEAEAENRLRETGLNVLKERQKLTPLDLLLNQFKSPILLILLIATVISAALGNWVDAIIIFVIILFSAVLSFVQEFNADKAAEMMQMRLKIKTDVLREGKKKSVPAEVIVPGDIIELSAGSIIPADAIILRAEDFFVNQSVLTGETFPVEKTAGTSAENAELEAMNNVVFMGTTVSSGYARCIVMKTGSATAFGQVAKRMVLKPPATEFERGVNKLSYLLTIVMLVLVLIIFAANIYFRRPVLDSLIFSIALAVGLTPQLLPAIININLSKGSQAMAKRGVIVRRLEAIENFGSIDILCTDKTGTLTEGAVTLSSALDVQGKESEDVLRSAVLNAGLQAGMVNQLDEAILKKESLPESGIEKLDEIPYDFIRKRLSVLVREGDEISLIMKGSVKDVLAVCNQARMDQQTVPLTPELIHQIEEKMAEWNSEGNRVLGVAVKSVREHTHNLTKEDETDMVFIGFLLFFDQPKADAIQTIVDLSELGINLKIITGDNVNAAKFIANAVGMKKVSAVTGSELNNMTDEALWHIAEKSNVFAEVNPNQKERIILALKKNGHVVGYMGDGINDAPSLHSADVGISVDNAVDVAKQAADFVLMKKDLTVLKDGIIEGRKTFANTLKYVFMAVSANFGNMFSMAIASLFLSFLPMLPKQLLLINTLTDLPEMTIATDNVDPIYISRPHRWNITFIRRFMLVFGTLSSLFDITTFVILLGIFKADEQLFHSGWFVESIISAILVVLVLRTQQPIGKNHPSVTMLLVTILVAAIAIYLPYSPIAGILGFIPIPWTAMLGIFVIAIVYFFAAEYTKRRFYQKYQP